MKKLVLLIFFLTAQFLGCQSKSEDTEKMSPDLSASKDSQKQETLKKVVGTAVECPVCGLRFGKQEATKTHKYKGKTYYFLLEDHNDAFSKDPTAFLKDTSNESAQQK